MSIKAHLLLIFIHSIIFVHTAGIVDFKFSDLDSIPTELVWCGPGQDNIIILTETNSIYLSENRGFTYKQLNHIFQQTGEKELEEKENEIGKVSKIIKSPVDKSLLIFLGTHGINWIGHDCGKRVQALNHGRKIQEYIFHPTEAKWGLASAFSLCEDFREGEPCKVFKELFVTQDLGANWELLGSYIVQFGWGVLNEDHIKQGIPKERILVTLDPRGKGDQKTTGWSYKVDFMYSDDFFKSKKIGVQKGNKFLLTKNYLFVAQVVDQNTQEVMLLSSSSAERVYNFQIVETSSKQLSEHSYTFLDSSEHSVFLHMNHFGEHSRWGHIYISDYNGLKYSESLKYNIRSTDNYCDFHKIESMEGSYMANVIDNHFMKDEELEYEKEIMEEDSMEEKPHKKRSSHEEDFFNYIESYITFNHGGVWRRLHAPNRDVNGKKFDCDEGECYLNIHGPTSEFSHFYSVESAAGIVIANGNVGNYLSHDPNDLSTFLSRDGGRTWLEVRKGAHHFEIGDHGALIVMAEDQKPTDSIHYTWDEGLTWQELKISNEKIIVKNVVIEPTSTTQHFIVYGEFTKKGEKKGVAVGLDFSSLHEPQCRNPEEPNSPNSDYETWIPVDENGLCLMGKKIIYIRRRREAECFNGLSYEKKTITTNCQCTEQDYECDVGYGRDSPSEACAPLDKTKTVHTVEGDIYTPPPDCSGIFTISKGYRKIPGNSCTNGTLFDPIEVQCSSSFFSNLGKILFIAVIATLLIGILLLVFNQNFFQNAIEFAQEKLGENKSMKKPDYSNIDLGPDTLMEETDNLEQGITIQGKEQTKKKSKKEKEKKKKEDDEDETFAINTSIKSNPKHED